MDNPTPGSHTVPSVTPLGFPYLISPSGSTLRVPLGLSYLMPTPEGTPPVLPLPSLGQGLSFLPGGGTTNLGEG